MTTIVNNRNITKNPRRRPVTNRRRVPPIRRTRVANPARRRAPIPLRRKRVPRNPYGSFSIASRPRGPDPRSMLSVVQSSPGGHDFLSCRVAPFNANGGMSSIPDGSMSRKIMLDHRVQIPFRLGNTGAMNIAITPCLPYPVWFQTPTTDTYIAAGNTYNTWTSASYNAICLPGWADGGIALRDSAGSYDDFQVVFNSGRSRIVTAAWSITYTGSTVNNSGSIRVNTVQAGVLAATPNTANFTVIDSITGHTEVWSPDQIMLRSITQNIDFGANNSQDTRTIPLRTGAHGLLRHNNSDYQWQDLSSLITFITTPADEKYCLLNSDGEITSNGKVGRVPVVSSFDSDWASTLLTISGAASNSTFLLDIIYCVEYTPNPSDTSYALAKPAPPRNDQVIQAVDRIANAQPIAATGNSASGTLTEALKTAASVVTTGASIAAAFM